MYKLSIKLQVTLLFIFISSFSFVVKSKTLNATMLNDIISTPGDSITMENVNDMSSLKMPPLSEFLASVKTSPPVKIYESMRKEEQAKLRKYKLEWLDFFRISGNAQYGKQFTLGDNSNVSTSGQYYVGVSNRATSQYSISFSMSIPIGQLFGKYKLDIDIQRARMEQMEYRALTTVEERTSAVLKAYNDVMQELAVLRSQAETAAIYNAEMKISEQNFVNGDMDIISLSLERGRRSGALESYEKGKVTLQNAILMLELLTNVKILGN